MREVSIIFDLDGTLLDTLRDLAETGNNVLQENGYPVHPEENYRTFVGNGVHVLVQRMLPEESTEETVNQCVKSFGKEYMKRWQNNCCPYTGVVDMLDRLKKYSIPLAVLSNKPHEFTVQFCEKFFPDNPFEVVFGQRDGFPKKPDPAVAIEIAERLGTQPENTFFVGDSGVDMQTARNAGMQGVGVSWGFRSPEELVDNGAKLVINEPLELLQYVGYTS